MSATATLPRAGGNGAALVVVIADLLMSFMATARASEAAKPKAETVKTSKKPGVWQLYRMSASDAVNPRVLQALSLEA